MNLETRPIEWSEDLSTGNTLIDNEHRHFISQVKELNRALIDHKEKSEIVEILNRALSDTKTHFVSEENFFSQDNYPKAGEHARKHQELLKQISIAMEHISHSHFSKEWIGIALSIRTTLVDHILIDDMEYIQYLRSK